MPLVGSLRRAIRRFATLLLTGRARDLPLRFPLQLSFVPCAPRTPPPHAHLPTWRYIAICDVPPARLPARTCSAPPLLPGRFIHSAPPPHPAFTPPYTLQPPRTLPPSLPCRPLLARHAATAPILPLPPRQLPYNAERGLPHWNAGPTPLLPLYRATWCRCRTHAASHTSVVTYYNAHFTRALPVCYAPLHRAGYCHPRSITRGWLFAVQTSFLAGYAVPFLPPAF